MSRARHQLMPAWVLRAQPYRDTSLLVEALTRDRGRIGLVARGARSGRSSKREMLQCFRPLLLSWTETGDLGSLGAVEPHGHAVELRGEEVFSGWYLNELLLRLTQRHDPHPQLFAAYSEALNCLPVNGEVELRYFELRLLAEIGFGLDLPESLDEAARYVLGPDTTIRQAASGEKGSCTGQTLIALREFRLEGETQLREARQLLRGTLAHYLGDKPLATASALRALRTS